MRLRSGFTLSGDMKVKTVRLLLLSGWVVFFLGIMAATLFGAPGRDPMKEAELHKNLESISPKAVDYFISATEAMDKNKTDLARDNFLRVLEIAPDFVPALRRLSYVLDNPETSLKFSRRAYDLDKHYYNLVAVVHSLLKQADMDFIEMREHLNQLLDAAPDDASVQQLICRAAMRIEQIPLLKKALKNLRRVAPDDMMTPFFAGIEAVSEKRMAEAEKEILRARELGLPADVAEKILGKAVKQEDTSHWRILVYSGYGIVAWIMGLISLLLIGMFLSSRTLSSIETGNHKIQIDEHGGMKLMRRIYAVVLGLTSAYFYISIPVVILLVIIAGGGLIYGFYAIGRIPIKMTLIIIGVICVTAYAMVKSLFTRSREEDPGPRLLETDAPSFFQTLKEVSAKISAPMVDSVFIVQDATAAVFEKGSFWKRLGGRTEKCLILGLGLLNGLSQLQLKSILAHEFGHISNRDTAGGSIALHVRRSIHASAQAMATGGAARWYNPGWIFINAFYRIFVRVSQGASRLQEVLADQWAALAYGSKGFIEGLRHAIRRGIEYDLISNLEINQAITEKRHLQNLYALGLPEQWPKQEENRNVESSAEEKSDKNPATTPREEVETAFNQRMKEETSAFDSHPAPRDRIRWVEALTDIPVVEDDGRPAWELLENAEALQAVMTQDLDGRVQAFIENN